jgi:cell division protein FtsW
VHRLRLVYWEKSGAALAMFALFLLVLVFIPGLGRTVNGATRWLALGVIGLQVAEFARLFLLIYLAGYLVRRGHEVRSSITGFIKPLVVFGAACLLILAQPDFGSAVVLLLTALGVMFLAGVRLWQFITLMAGITVLLSLLAVSSPYRMQRLTAFLNPWADPFNSGFQLTQSLIAFGSGGWTGVGLGGSVQKLFYLPEAHNDFLLAILGEELGLFGVWTVLVLFVLLVWRGMAVGCAAEKQGFKFGAYLAYGLTLWIAIQAMINVGVSMGLLPTKGLTLPLVSAGGSSLLVMCIAVGLLLRVHLEVTAAQAQALKRSRPSGLWGESTDER